MSESSRSLLVLVIAGLSMLACGESGLGQGDGLEGTEGTAEDTGASGDTSSGDGADTDGTDTDSGEEDTGSDDPPVPCDLETLELVTPDWVEVLPQPASGWDDVHALALAGDGVFLAARHLSEDGLAGGFIERRSLDGSLAWRLDEPGIEIRRIAWDGQHLYFASGSEIYRIDVDGVIDPSWSYWVEPTFGSITALGVTGPKIVLGLYALGEDIPHESPPGFGRLQGWLKEGGGFFDVELGEDTSTTWVIPWSGGGHLATLRKNHGVLLQGFEGAPHYAVLQDLGGQPWVSFVVERPDGVMVVGTSANYDAPADSWTRTVDVDGNELRRTSIEACGDASSTAVVELAQADDRLVGLAWVETQAGAEQSIVVELDLDGQLLRSYRVMGTDDQTRLRGLTASPEAVVVSAGRVVDGVGVEAWVARLE